MTYVLDVLCQIWFLMGSWLAPYPDKLPVYAAALLAYVAYDVTHYFLHFGTAFNGYSRRMKVRNSAQAIVTHPN